MITITEDKSSDMFKYKAIVETLDGKKVHLVLPQVENFLYKLDLAQREMGKVPNEFVPVKYANEASLTQNNAMMNFMIGGLFLALMLQIYLLTDPLFTLHSRTYSRTASSSLADPGPPSRALGVRGEGSCPTRCAAGRQ